MFFFSVEGNMAAAHSAPSDDTQKLGADGSASTPAPKAGKKTTTPSPADAFETGARPKKLSGFENLQRRRARAAAEQSAHAARLAQSGEVPQRIEPCRDLMKAHFYQLQRILDMQHLILTDPTIPNEAKARHVVAFGQTMAKLRVDAEIEQELAEIRTARAIELAEMQELELELEREKKALAALRRELEDRARRAA